MIRSASILVIAGTVFAQSPPEVRPSAAPASVSGIVVSSTTGETLRKATIWLANSRTNDIAARTTSDNEGKFFVNGVAPGHYRVEAERFGYVSTAGRSDAEMITVYDGQQVKGIAVKLIPHGSVTVRVADDDGDPWIHSSVQIYAMGWNDGRFELVSGDASQVDDRGQYRFGDLRPGRYYVRASAEDGWKAFPGKTTPGEQLQPTWFGGAMDAENAIPIQLTPGENRDGLEIRLRSGHGYRIAGNVTGAERVQAPGNAGSPYSLSLSRVESLVRDPGAQLRQEPGGRFFVDGLLPGIYELIAYSRNRSGGGVAVTRLAKTRVELRNGDISDVQLDIHPPTTVVGRVVLDGDMPEPKRLSVWLEDLDGASQTSAVTDTSGRFELPFVASGRYLVRMQDAEGRAYLKRVEVGGSPAPGSVIEVGPEGAGELELTISDRGATVWGQLKPPDAPTGTIWLIPEMEDSLLRQRMARSATIDQNGTFWVRNLPPGKYKAYSWEGTPVDAWKNPRFLERMESRGLAFQLQEGQQLSLEVPLVPATETAGLLAELGMTP